MPLETPVPPPAHVADLPTDARGYFVPAEAPWIDGLPKLAGLDPHRKTALAFNWACNVCGYPMVEGQPVYRAFSQRDAANIRLYQEPVSVESATPGHLSCMLFSMFACPYW